MDRMAEGIIRGLESFGFHNVTVITDYQRDHVRVTAEHRDLIRPFFMTVQTFLLAEKMWDVAGRVVREATKVVERHREDPIAVLQAAQL